MCDYTFGGLFLGFFLLVAARISIVRSHPKLSQPGVVGLVKRRVMFEYRRCDGVGAHGLSVKIEMHFFFF